MKKALTILVAMLFVVVAVGAVFAADTTFEGQYKIRAWSNWNFDKRPNHLNSQKGLYTGYFDQRFRLTITHARSEFLKAVIQIDLVEDTWGQQRNFRINNNTNGELVRKAYLEFTLPKIGTFTVGKQPVVLGAGLAFSDSSGYLDGIKWANKWGPVGVSAMYFKFNDNVALGGGSEFYNRDTDIWALHLMITPNENHAIELFGGYVNYRAGLPSSHNLGYIPFMGLDLLQAHVGFAGIAYIGEIADMITLKGEFSGVFGRADLSNWTVGDRGLITGYNLYLDASWHNDLLRVGLGFVHGSGDTMSGINANHFNVNFITADEFVFGNIIASGNGGMQDDFGGGLGFCDDIENLTAVKLYFEVSPTEKLSINAAVIWARWTEPVGLTSAYDHPVNYYAGLGKYNQWYNSATDLGWEIDLGLSYEIMEGLSYTLAAGVLFTGDSFDYVGDPGGANTHESWGPIWTVNNNLIYEF
ncbi:MAG: hypothetical protein JW765_11455 [Deltaproteobacteria bacterium]|nr:hypothetical protein [Candidatus Zymogenaceae bacterium]